MPVILAVQEIEIRKVAVQRHLGQIVHETIFQKYSTKTELAE
jgi:hypothetical protein